MQAQALHGLRCGPAAPGGLPPLASASQVERQKREGTTDEFTASLFTQALQPSVAMAFSCVPQLKPSLYDYPVGQSLLQQLLKLHTSQNQIHGEKVQQNSTSAKQKIFTTKDIIKTNRSTPEDMKPKPAKPPDKMEENTYKTKVVVSDTSENSSAFFGVYRSGGVSNKVQSPQITESDTSNASTKKIPWEEYKGELKISGKEHIYNKSKKEFYLNTTEQPATLVSEITKEIVMTVSKKLETFAFSRKTFSNCSQISSTQSAHLGQITHQSGCTNRSLLNEGKCETCSVQQLSLNDQQGAIDQLSEVNEMNQIVLKVNHPGLKLSDCIRDILMSILGSILKQLDQNNSLKLSSRHMLSMQEGRILRTLVSSVLNDVSLGIRDAILPTVIPAISEKESQLEGNLNDPYCPSHTVPEPKLVDAAQFSCDHEKVIENPAFDTPKAMSDAENKHSKSMKVIDIPCALDNDSSQSSGKLSSESDSAQDNALREQEVKASKMKIRNIMKTTEYVANDMLAKILADGEFPLKTDTCKTQTQPFSEKNVFLFVMRNVESILKLLSLAFNYNIVSRTIDISGVYTSPFMGLCADMKVFKENLTDEIHEVPNEYTVKLQNIMGIKRTEDKKAGCSVVEELYMLFIQLIMDELELFLTQKSRSNIVKSRKKTGNPIKEKAIVRVPVLQIFSNKDMPVTQYKLPQGEVKYSHNLINTSEVSHTITETGATTALVHSKLYIFAKTFLNTLLIGIKNSALKENQKKAAGVITSVSDNDGIIRICALILETASSEKDANRDSDPIDEKPANQKTGSIDSTASSNSNHNEKEKMSSSSLRMSNDSSENMPGTSPSPLQANNDNENDNKLGLCCLKRVSRLSKADAIVCVKKMFPVIQAVKQIVSENLDKIVVDLTLMDPCHCKKFDADSLFPVNDVISFTIDITETMLKMLSVAFEQVGVFHGATKGHFIGLCAELRLLKIDIDCHTSFAEVDRSFVNTFAEKSQTQDPLKHDTSIITLNEIGQHLVYMISKKFARFIQVHCRHDSRCKRAKNDKASDPPFYVSLLPKLYPYAREISEFMFNLINKTLYEEEKKSAPKCVVKRIDDKVSKKQTGTTCSELTDAKFNSAVKIVKLQEPHKAVKEAGNCCGNGTDVCVTYNSLYYEEDLKHESECEPPGTFGEDNFASLGYDSNSVLTEFQNIATIVFEHVISKLEEETNTQQSSQVIQMVKQIVNDIFQMYSVNLLLPHIYNTSYNINISEAILKLTTQDADTFVSKDEIVFLYSDIISIIFEKLHSAFICATEAKAATGCKEYHHPALGKFTVEQIDNPHEQSFKNWLCRQEIFAEMTNNSNNKQGHIFHMGEYGNIKSSTPCSGLTDQFVDGVLQMVTDRVESFVAMKVESVFCHANHNTNMSARTSTYAGVPQSSHLKEQESQRRMYATLTNNGSEFAETVINLVVKQTSDFILKFNVSDNSTPYSFTAGNTGMIVETVKLHASIPDNPWSALSVPVSLLFSSNCLKDITTCILKAIFCLHGNNVSCTKRERMLSDSEFRIISTHLRNRVLCEFSKNQTWNISRSNCLKAKMDIQKAAASVHCDVLETYRPPQAMQATFGTNSGDIVERLSKATILKMAQFLHPFVSEDLADKI